jgi:hypothetical protein
MQDYVAHDLHGLWNPQTMSIVALFLSIAMFFIVMGRRKSYNPRDYHGYDIENTPEHVSESSSPLEDSTGASPPRHRRRTHSQSHIPDVLDDPKFRIICPCRICEGDQKRHSRLYSTVLRHLRQHLMGEKFKVNFYIPTFQ